MLFSLLKLWSAGELPKSSATYYGLNIWLLVILLLSHCIDIIFTPLDDGYLTEDSFVCSLHGLLYLFHLWFYSISMFVAVECSCANSVMCFIVKVFTKSTSFTQD